MLIKRLYSKTTELFKEGNFNQAIKLSEYLIRLDEYNEDYYYYLIQSKINIGENSSAIENYLKYEKKLWDDLDTTPSEKIYYLIKDYIIDSSLSIGNEKKPVGRTKEREVIFEEINKFFQNKKYYNILISGERGYGKSTLIKWVLHNYKENNIIRINGDSLFNTIESEAINYVDNIFNKYRDRSLEKTVLIIDEIELVEKKILRYLYKKSRENFKDSFYIFTSARNSGNIQNYFSVDFPELLVKCINLQTLTEVEVVDYISDLENGPQTKVDIKNLSYLSGNNPFYLTRILASDDLKNLEKRPEITKFIERKQMTLSEDEKAILSYAAFMLNEVDYKALAALMEKSELQIINYLDNLQELGFLDIEENEDQGMIYIQKYTIEKLYFYNQTTEIRKKLIQEIMVDYYINNENTGVPIIQRYQIIINHLYSAGNRVEAFNYRVEYIKHILKIHHEVFPIEIDTSHSHAGMEIADADSFLDIFKSLLNEYRELKEENYFGLQESYLQLLLIYGRFLKSSKEDERGIRVIRNLIKLAKAMGKKSFIYQGYVQVVQHGINTDNLTLIDGGLKEIKKLLPNLDDKANIGVYYRYYGYYQLALKNYDEATKSLTRAISLFYSLDNSEVYTMNLAACTFYLGEIEASKGEYKKAISYYLNAYDFCREDQDLGARAVILSKIGIANYELSNIQEAKYYIGKAADLYNKSIFYWGKEKNYQYYKLLFPE